MSTTRSNRRSCTLAGLALVLSAGLVLPATALAWDLPPPVWGSWSVAVWEDAWARGEAMAWTNMTSGAAGHANLATARWSTTSSGRPNDEISSYQVCNNTEHDRVFVAEFFRDANFTSRFQADRFVVESESCVIRDVIINDVASSFWIFPESR